MKIGIYDPYLETLGGGEKYMLTAASCLSKNHEVFLFWNDELILKKAHSKFNLDLGQVKLAKNIFYSKISFFERFLKTNKYQRLIYLSDGSFPLIFGKKLIIHFQFPVEWTDGNSLKTKIKLNQVRNIICNSLFTKDYIDKKFGVKSIVLYPPVEIKKKITLKKEKIILNVGRFSKVDEKGTNQKRQQVMIEVFKQMVDLGLKNWQFILVVSLQDQDQIAFSRLKKMAQDYPIKFVVNPNYSLLWENYEKAMIYWHATGFGEDLEKHPERAEHFGISTVEAMGVGAVPVVIEAGGQKEIISEGENGYLWKTKKELIEKTKKLIENPNLWQEKSEEAIKRADFFNLDKFCEGLNEVIK